MKKEIRLLLVNNPTSSLFMAARFEQEKESLTPLKNVAVYTTIKKIESSQVDVEKKKSDYERISRLVLGAHIDSWFSCQPESYDEYLFSLHRPLDTILQRLTRTYDLTKIKEALKKNNVALEQVAEIWLSSNCFAPHFSYLFQDVPTYYFEHGLSDVRHILDTKSHNEFKLHQVKSIAKHIEKTLLYFESHKHRQDFFVSMLKDEITKTRFLEKIIELESAAVLTTAAETVRKDPTNQNIEALNGSALILLESVLSWNKSWSANQKFYHAFEKNIVEEYAEDFQARGIKTIVFKGRYFFEDFAARAISEFSELKKKFKVVYLTDISPMNYPIEFYLAETKPKILVAAYSSGLFYAKKLQPQLETLSYDAWLDDYVRSEFQTGFPDLDWLRNYFETPPRLEGFKGLLPG